MHVAERGALYNNANSPNPFPGVNSLRGTFSTNTLILPFSKIKNELAPSPYFIIVYPTDNLQ